MLIVSMLTDAVAATILVVILLALLAIAVERVAGFRRGEARCYDCGRIFQGTPRERLSWYTSHDCTK